MINYNIISLQSERQDCRSFMDDILI